MNRLLLACSLFCFGVLLFNSCLSSIPEKQDPTPQELEEKKEKEKKTMGIDTLTSVIQWKAQLVGGETQQGILRLSESVIVVQQGRIVHGRFTINMNSLQVTNKQFEPLNNSESKQILEFLAQEEYLDLENHPTARFEVIKHFDYNLKGTLVINGRKNVEYIEDVRIKEVNGEMEIHGTMSVDRHRFGIGGKRPVRNKLLADVIDLKIIIRD
ncbi:MAG: YceI family protein [Salinivirgaceae bacterium]|jgi:polyisoprenoid-binding protein YceI|nr:YceI family protein [Salinivirgaceae bacterium]